MIVVHVRRLMCWCVPRGNPGADPASPVDEGSVLHPRLLDGAQLTRNERALWTAVVRYVRGRRRVTLTLKNARPNGRLASEPTDDHSAAIDGAIAAYRDAILKPI